MARQPTPAFQIKANAIVDEQVIDALKYLTGDELTDAEREWQCRVVEIMLAREENHQLQRP